MAVLYKMAAVRRVASLLMAFDAKLSCFKHSLTRNITRALSGSEDLQSVLIPLPHYPGMLDIPIFLV